MAGLAQGLDIEGAPEEIAISPVRLDMVGDQLAAEAELLSAVRSATKPEAGA